MQLTLDALAQEMSNPRHTWVTHDLDQPILVACSGGGDSVALLHASVRAYGAGRIHVATVDHNLRDVTAELDLVARHCLALDVPHRVHNWSWDGKGNLQDAARKGRQRLLRDHAASIETEVILLGHTADDQAETFLMRLARGSGVDGLASMPGVREGFFFRPLLDHRRADLRAALTAEGLEWADDPSNDDLRFDRVKARRMLATLGPLGLTHERIMDTVTMMQGELQVIKRSLEAARKSVVSVGPDLEIPRSDFESLPWALQTRLILHIIWWFARPSRPRRSELMNILAAVAANRKATLSGVIVMAGDNDTLRFTREQAAVEGPLALAPDQRHCLWDTRWAVTAPARAEPAGPGVTVGALGEDIDLVDWRAKGLPRQVLMTTPAVRRNGALIAAPYVTPSSEWTAQLFPAYKNFRAGYSIPEAD